MGRTGNFETAQSIGAFFRNNKKITHLDLSYNNFSSQECEILADNIKQNHTIYGIHTIGNDCLVDCKGFIIPNLYPNAAEKGPFFVRLSGKQKTHLNLRNIDNCWIC